MNAAVRSVQPAVSGLFQVHTPRVWTDAVDEAGLPGANGVPDFLETWQAFRAREDSASLKNAYAFRTIDGQGDEILYAGVQRLSAGGPGKVVFEFNQKPGERLAGDLRIGAEIDGAGNLGTVRFESYGDGKAGLNLRALLSGEGCSETGAACIVANGALLEVGVNLTRFLTGSTERYKGIQISTPEDSVVGLFSLTGVAGGCVSEASGFKAGCTANDIQLTAIVPGSLSISNNQCVVTNGVLSGTVTFSATGVFVLTSQTRYDVGLFIDTNGDPEPSAKLNGKDVADAGRNGQCTRFAFSNTDGINAESPADGCGDLTDAIASNNLVPPGRAMPFGPVTIKCVDKDADGKVDVYHCETWSQNAGGETCSSSTDVKAGTSSKCNCGILAGACIATPSNNQCTENVCALRCSNNSATVCTIGGSQCTAPGFCTDTLVTQNKANGSTCGDQTSGDCKNPDTCVDGVCTTGYKPSTTECRAKNGQCDIAESCTGSSTTCPAQGFQPSTTACVGASNGGVCDGTDSCAGTTNTCVDGYKSSTTSCRAANGQCDVGESCTGSSGACPADGFQPSTTACVGASNGGVCDGTDSCAGTTNTCVDGYKSSTTQCRESAGCCDVPESCTGTSGACPADGFQPATTICRPSAGKCDAAESCTGSSASCPGDACSAAPSPPDLTCSVPVA